MTWAVNPPESLDLETRHKVLEPAIDIINFLDTAISDVRFCECYSVGPDYEYAMFVLDFAQRRYPSNEQRFFSSIRQKGLTMAEHWK